MRKPKGLLGIKWETDALDAVARLGITGGSWRSWVGNAGFEVYSGADTMLKIFDEDGEVRLVRRGMKVEGIEVVFARCDDQWEKLNADVRRHFDMHESESEIYHVWNSGELVRLTRDIDKGQCVLTLAGTHFGKVYVAYLLKRGFRDLLDSMSPH